MSEIFDRGRKLDQVSLGAGVTIEDDPNDSTSAGSVLIFSGGGTGHTIEDEGTPVTTRTAVNFTGAGVSVADAGGKTVITIPASSAPSGAAGGDLTGTYPDPTLVTAGPGAVGPIGSATTSAVVSTDANGRVSALSSATIPYTTVEDEGTPLTQRSNLNFAGSGVTVTDSGGKSLVTIPGGTFTGYDTVQDEGSSVTQRSTANFVGAGVSVIDSGGKTTITIPGTTSGTGTDNSLSWRLSGTHNAGVTSITINAAPLAVGANLGFLIIDPYTIEAEIRKVTNITASTFTVAATTYAHADGDVAMWFPGGLVPWSWWGAKSGNSAFASDNVTAFNRLSQQLYNLSAFYYGGILIPQGVYFVDNELTPERDQVIAGVNVMSSKVQAHTTFAFSGTEIAIFHPKRDGTPCTFQTGGASSRWIFRDLFVDGNLVAGSNGILSSPQQPDGWNNIRVDKCLGYGVGISDVQQHIMNNMEFDQCNISLRLRDARFVWVDGLNSEHATGTHVLQDSSTPAGAGCFQNSFSNVHIEQGGSAATSVFTVDSTGSTGDSSGHLFDHIWLTNSGTITLFKFPDAATASSYQIRNARMYGSPSSVTAISDTNRGLALNAFTDFNSRIYNYQASTAFFAGASSVYGAPSYVARGGASEARISVSESSSSFHTPTFYSRRGSGNDKHMVCLDSTGTEVLTLTYAGGIIVGGGTELKKVLSSAATYDPPSTANGATWIVSVSVTGATLLNSVATASHSTAGAGWILSASVTGTGVVTVTGLNLTGSTQDLASGTLRVVVEQF